LHDNATKANSTGILLNSSTGKDSTLMVALYFENARARLMAGKAVLPAIVGISDTGSEFPDMAIRMREEVKTMTECAREMNLPIEVKLVQPPAKSRLLVEIIGGGLALPQLKNGGSSSGFVGASWCLDRVKATPLQTILTDARERFPYFIQCVGVRSAESAKRAATMRKYAEELPLGLTNLDGGRDSATRLGATPIAHWSDKQLRQWMLEGFAMWDALSNDNLRHIYALGSKPDERAGECVLTITKEGAVSNVCSDLSGARFGCWMCLLSTNKSLGNAAEQDKRYAPLKAFHSYLFGHHLRGDNRRELRNESGHNDMSSTNKPSASGARAVSPSARGPGALGLFVEGFSIHSSWS
jgi:DNA sulfur modification protein DndC